METCYNCEKETEDGEEYAGIYLCEECEQTLDNKSGYCSIDCQLGYGCDGSC